MPKIAESRPHKIGGDLTKHKYKYSPIIPAEAEDTFDEDGPTEHGSPSKFSRISSLLLVGGAGLLLSSLAAFSKYVQLPTGEYIVIETTFNVAVTLLVCSHLGVDLYPWGPEPGWRWFWSRAITGAIGHVGKLLCVKMMDVGDATAIYFTSPIWAGLMARCILKEKYTLVLFPPLFAWLVSS